MKKEVCPMSIDVDPVVVGRLVERQESFMCRLEILEAKVGSNSERLMMIERLRRDFWVCTLTVLIALAINHPVVWLGVLGVVGKVTALMTSVSKV